MALHPEFPRSPYAELRPTPLVPRCPGASRYRLRAPAAPLVANIRKEVKAWRDAGYVGAAPTSRALLNWWFDSDHLVEQADGTQSQFRYYFAQREAVETVVWLHDARRVRDKFDLLRFDASGSPPTSASSASTRRGSG
jgi:type III restriction enzyme